MYFDCIKKTESYKYLKIKLHENLGKTENINIESSIYDISVTFTKDIKINEDIIIEKILDKYINTFSNIYDNLYNDELIELKMINFTIIDVCIVYLFVTKEFWSDLIYNCLKWEDTINNSKLCGDFNDLNLTDSIKEYIITKINKKSYYLKFSEFSQENIYATFCTVNQCNCDIMKTKWLNYETNDMEINGYFKGFTYGLIKPNENTNEIYNEICKHSIMYIGIYIEEVFFQPNISLLSLCNLDIPIEVSYTKDDIKYKFKVLFYSK